MNQHLRPIHRGFDAVQLGSIELFCKAAEQQSFTLAANLLGITPAAVSRSVARLEARLQVKLFVRTTRQIRLTDAGKAYYEQCTQALQQIRDAELSLLGKQREPSGSLRVSLPTTYGHHRLLPLMPKFFERYPKITRVTGRDQLNHPDPLLEYVPAVQTAGHAPNFPQVPSDGAGTIP